MDIGSPSKGKGGEGDSLASLVLRLDKQIKQYRDQSNRTIVEVEKLYSENLEQ